MYCAKCGKKLIENAVFCGYCGNKIDRTFFSEVQSTENDHNHRADKPAIQKIIPVIHMNSKDAIVSSMGAHWDAKGTHATQHDNFLEEDLIIQSRLDSRKLINKCIKLAAFVIIVGIAAVMMGKWFDSHTPWYNRHDFDDFMFDALIVMGYIDIFFGILIPFLPKIISDRPILCVYDSHVEGKGLRNGSFGQIASSLIGFNEPIFNISSVSEDRNSIILNMKDGSNIRCSADNANEITIVLRTLIKKASYTT